MNCTATKMSSEPWIFSNLSHPKDNTDPLWKEKESECNLEKSPNKSVSVLGYRNCKSSIHLRSDGTDFSDENQEFCQASQTAGTDVGCGQWHI